MLKKICYLLCIIAALLTSCQKQESGPKGLRISSDPIQDSSSLDSLPFMTRPGRVLLTGIPEYRLTPVYKVNLDKKGNYYTGSNQFHTWYHYHTPDNGNQWNDHIMPGFEAVYGYNMVNISMHYTANDSRTLCFDSPVLIKTLYYPSFSRDTLNFIPVTRNYYLISVYDQDTNNDGFINEGDFRHFYYFDLRFNNKTSLVPANYSVIRSQYDPANDYMYVFASPDSDKTGIIDAKDEIHIFWIDLKNPKNNGKAY